MDTIFALASARGRAGVSVVRISGELAGQAAFAIAGPLPEPRRVGLRVLRDAGGDPIDEGLVVVFPRGQSFTGEEVVELHLHGSQAIVSAVLARLGQIPGLRLADPGEFTRRALENGRLDLAQVEGLSDLIDSETESQRRQAMRVLSGAVGARAESWRGDLIEAAALIETTIDFADEEVPVDVTPEVLAIVDRLLAELHRELAGSVISERIRDGFEVAILGAPNVGKSTLLNALAGREAAITSEIAGTTRDVIEVRMDLRGLAVTFLDTAGLRDSEDLVERVGVERAVTRAGAADLRVFLVDERGMPPHLMPRDDDLVVRGKSDLQPGEGLAVSGKTGAGVQLLVERIGGILIGRAAGAATITRARHREAIHRAIGAMESARLEVLNGAQRAELAAEELRSAIRALDSLVGRVDVEDLLGEIFARFCIGK